MRKLFKNKNKFDFKLFILQNKVVQCGTHLKRCLEFSVSSFKEITLFYLKLTIFYLFYYSNFDWDFELISLKMSL